MVYEGENVNPGKITFLSTRGKKVREEWNFGGISAIASDKDGHIYVGDNTVSKSLLDNNIRDTDDDSTDITESIHMIKKYDSEGAFITAWGGTGGEDGQFFGINGISVSPDGYIYITDFDNRIQKFDSQGKFICKWGKRGVGNGAFIDLHSITVDSMGFVYVTEGDSSCVQKFDGSGNFITRWYTMEKDDHIYKCIRHITSDRENSIYVLEYYLKNAKNNCVKKYDSSGKFITMWGKSGSGDGQFLEPYSITSDEEGYIYVADRGNGNIQKFDKEGNFLAKWDKKGKKNGEFERPSFITAAPYNFIYVAEGAPFEHVNKRIQKFDKNGNFIMMWGRETAGKGDVSFPSDVALSPDGHVYISDKGNKNIQKFDKDGTFILEFNGSVKLQEPQGLAVDRRGNIYVADRGPCYIKKFDSNGNFISEFGKKDIEKLISEFLSFGFPGLKIPEPGGIAVDRKGFIYITDILNHRVLKTGSKGSLIAIWGKKGDADGEFDRPSGIAVDSKDNIYICDTCNDRIQIFKSNGNFITSWKGDWKDDTEFRTPCAIATDRNDYIYVLEGDFYGDGNNRIQIFDSSGKIIGKTGKKGVFDGEFNRPSGIAVDIDFNIYVADTGNSRLQKFSLEIEDVK